MPATAPADDPHALLTAPGGRGRLRRDGDALVSEDGRRCEVQDGIVGMLGPMSAALSTDMPWMSAVQNQVAFSVNLAVNVIEARRPVALSSWP